MARDLSNVSALVECGMEISAIKPPGEPTEGEPPPSSLQASEPAFLQLLASLSLTPPLPVDAQASATSNDETVAQGDSPGIVPSGLVCVLTLTAAEERMTTAGKANTEAAPVGTQVQAAATPIVASPGNNPSDPAGTASEALATSEKNV